MSPTIPFLIFLLALKPMNEEIIQAKVRLYVALISVPSDQLDYFEAEILLILAKDPVIRSRSQLAA